MAKESGVDHLASSDNDGATLKTNDANPNDSTIPASHLISQLPPRDNVHLKILVPSIAAGAIIGRGGEAITEIQNETLAKVKMSKVNDFYPGTTERVCLIIGTIESVLKVFKYISEKVNKKPDALLRPSTKTRGHSERHKQVKILVPNSTAGIIIGRGGIFIKKLKYSTGAFIQVSQRSRQFNLAERCVTVAGELAQTYEAVAQLLVKIADDPQSSSYPNVSYAEVRQPVANAHPTGSPIALSSTLTLTPSMSLNQHSIHPSPIVKPNESSVLSGQCLRPFSSIDPTRMDSESWSIFGNRYPSASNGALTAPPFHSNGLSAKSSLLCPPATSCSPMMRNDFGQQRKQALLTRYDLPQCLLAPTTNTELFSSPTSVSSSDNCDMMHSGGFSDKALEEITNAFNVLSGYGFISMPNVASTANCRPNGQLKSSGDFVGSDFYPVLPQPLSSSHMPADSTTRYRDIHRIHGPSESIRNSQRPPNSSSSADFDQVPVQSVISNVSGLQFDRQSRRHTDAVPHNESFFGHKSVPFVTHCGTLSQPPLTMCPVIACGGNANETTPPTFTSPTSSPNNEGSRKEVSTVLPGALSVLPVITPDLNMQDSIEVLSISSRIKNAVGCIPGN